MVGSDVISLDDKSLLGEEIGFAVFSLTMVGSDVISLTDKSLLGEEIGFAVFSLTMVGSDVVSLGENLLEIGEIGSREFLTTCSNSGRDVSTELFFCGSVNCKTVGIPAVADLREVSSIVFSSSPCRRLTNSVKIVSPCCCWLYIRDNCWERLL